MPPHITKCGLLQLVFQIYSTVALKGTISQGVCATLMGVIFRPVRLGKVSTFLHEKSG